MEKLYAVDGHRLLNPAEPNTTIITVRELICKDIKRKVAATRIQTFARTLSAKMLLKQKKHSRHKNEAEFIRKEYLESAKRGFEEKKKERRAALLIIDVQNDFLPPTGSLAVKRGTEVVPVINELRKKVKWSHIVLTQDWHPKGHCSFCSTHQAKGAEVFTLWKLESGHMQMMWPDHCVQGSEGAKFHKDLVVDEKNDSIVQKGTHHKVDSYSGFFDNDHKSQSNLSSILKEHGITDVYLAGIAYDYCVGYSALDAVGEGFATFVVEDGCRGVAQDTIDQMIERLKKGGVKIIQSSEIPESGLFS